MTGKLGFLTVLLMSIFILTGCSMDDAGNTSTLGENRRGDSIRPISDESPEVVFEDWMGAVTGTIEATGRDSYRSAGGLDFPGEGRVLDDFMPANPCAAAVEDKDDAGYLRLYVSARGGYTDFDEPLAKVAAYWRSQGWEPEPAAGAAEISEAIVTTTTHGTFIQYTAGAGGDVIEAKSPCLYAFNSPEKWES